METIKQKVKLLEKLELTVDLDIYKVYKEFEEFGDVQTDVEEDDLYGDDGFLQGFLANGCPFLSQDELNLLKEIHRDCKKSYYA